jgi:prepilin peptidase CpaA
MTIAAASLGFMTVAACAAAIVDIRSRRIPNGLTAALAATALAAHAFGGAAGAVDALVAMGAVFSLGTVAFSLGWFGGGDVKLAAACAGAVGAHALPLFMLDVSLAGGVLAVVAALRESGVLALFASSARAARGLAPTSGLRVPYGVAIAAGSIAYTVPYLIATH